VGSPGRLTLPGGIVGAEGLRRDVVIEPLTGSIEQALVEAAADIDNLPLMVSTVLGLALRSVGGTPADRDLAGSLCVADRQYLMLKLAQMIHGDQLWLQSICEHCGEPFDIDIERSMLPVVEAGEGFPIVEIDLGDHRLQVRVPTGDDQEAIAALDDGAALRALLGRCIVSVQPAAPREGPVDELSQAEIETIEAALDAISPAVSTTAQVRCPECGAEQRVALDPYTVPGLDPDRLYQEIHTLAIWYHWSEPAILALPRERRQRYLRLIDQARGLHG
jgi:hypothetical protein